VSERTPPHGAEDRREDDLVSESLEVAGGPAAGSLQRARAAFEARYITEALRRHGGNVTRAAQALGLSRVALHRKMKEYGLRDAGGNVR
jgi:DNA-binding NtrC family response regulator